MQILTTCRRTAACAMTLGALASAAGAQQTYPQTLLWGAGLIDVPVAWVSPVSGDFAFNYAGRSFRNDGAFPPVSYGAINSKFSFSMSFAGRAEMGIAVLSSNPEWGFFGQGLLLDEESFRHRGGVLHWIPSVAVGVRNAGPYDQIDRFGVGYRLISHSPEPEHRADALHKNFRTAATVYGVATKSFALISPRTIPGLNLSFSAGYGTGLFKDDGGLGNLYSRHATGGVFGGTKLEFVAGRNTRISLMAEDNAWDYNVGGVLDFHGFRGGVYWLEAGRTGGDTVDIPSKELYNYGKFAFTLGWQSNILALLRGDAMARRVAALEKRRQMLLAEIDARQQRIASLQQDIDRFQAQGVLDLEQRRAQAEDQIRAERQALQQLEERLRRLEQPAAGQTPPQATPAGSTPQ